MTKQEQIRQAKKNIYRAFEMYEECGRCRKLAMNKNNWRHSQVYWGLVDLYRDLANMYNRHAQRRFELCEGLQS